ncbi:MAG: hypothetical protein Q3997_02440 [Propionibacteriaceae bacterium]|nr:hypothetical protein [Propionibacteriaceae bacterium]
MSIASAQERPDRDELTGLCDGVGWSAHPRSPARPDAAARASANATRPPWLAYTRFPG